MEKISKNLLNGNDGMEPVRLNRFLSDAGFCSRREADRLIEQGRVIIDGHVAQLGEKVLPGQRVECAGKAIEKEEEMILLAFNKPAGIECTTSKESRNNIVDFIKYPKRIYPVGRLDVASTGLILLTNAGGLVNEILKASNAHEKEYFVKVNKPLTQNFLDSMEKGVEIELEDGKKKVITRKCRIEATGKTEFKIVLTQGLNRQIRKMCSSLGYKVTELKRLRIMNISLGNLPEGHYRHVTEPEIRKLLKDLGVNRHDRQNRKN